LIWVYNPGVSCNGGSWPPYQTSEYARRKLFYPGDAFCDITGIDLYDYDPAARGTFASTGKTYRDAWNMMKAIAPAKMIALCESEGLPNMEKTFSDPTYAPWLYCLPWFSDSYTDNTTGVLRDLCAWNKIQFKSPYVINAGDFIITANETSMLKGQTGMHVYPNPATQSVTIAFNSGAFSGNVKVSLMDLAGKTVYQGGLVKDQLVVSTAGLAKGMYLVKATDGNIHVCEKIIIQ
jgi:hypothetical protein